MLRGHLDVRSRLIDSRLVLTLEAGTLQEEPHHTLTVDARFSRIDELGDWQFEGIARVGERRTPVTISARAHGIYRRGERMTAWLSLRAERAPVGDGPRRHLRLWRSSARPRRLFEVEINAGIETA